MISNHASVRLIEAASCAASSEQAWLDRVFRAWRDALPSAAGVGVFALDEKPRGASFSFRGGAASPSIDAATATRFLERARLDGRRAVAGSVNVSETKDSVGIVIQSVPGTVLVLIGLFDGLIVLERHRRIALEQLGLHLEGGYRHQRLGPSSAIAEVSTDGEIERFDANALELWPALVEGRASVVYTGARAPKRYRVVPNPPHARRLRALTAREIDILSHAVGGDSTKSIALTLGISAPLVSTGLASAAAKLGVATRTELIRLAALLTRASHCPVEYANVTSAEREVLALLKEGLDNEEIARVRGRSVRTIANQVASLMRKTGRGSRRALVVC